jgi:hypothetical protein
MSGFRAGAIIQNSTDEIDIGDQSNEWEKRKAEWWANRKTGAGWEISAAALRLRRGPGPNRRTQSVRYRIGMKGRWRRYGYRTEDVQYDLYKPLPRNPDATPTIRDLAKYRWRGQSRNF